MGQIGANFLYRYEPIIPLFSHAVAMSPSATWNSVIGYQLKQMPNARFVTTILWLASAKHLTQLAIYEGHNKGDGFSSPFILSTCELRRLKVGRDYDILERLRDGSKSVESVLTPRELPTWRIPFDEDAFGNNPEIPPGKPAVELIKSLIMEGNMIFLGTTHSIFRFPTESCASYTTEEACLASGDPHCAWNVQTFHCVSILNSRESQTLGLSLSVDVTKRPHCPAANRQIVQIPDMGWSKWRPCFMTANFHSDTASQTHHSCLCRICLSETLCNLGEQQISQCKGNL